MRRVLDVVIYVTFGYNHQLELSGKLVTKTVKENQFKLGGAIRQHKGKGEKDNMDSRLGTM